MSQLFNFSVHDLGRHRAAAAAAVALLPVVVPSVYVVYLNWAVRRTMTCSSGQLSAAAAAESTAPSSSSSSAPPPSTPDGIPKDVLARPEDWVVSYERVVSHPIPAATLVHKLLRGGREASSSPSPLFTAYLRATFRAFSWTPQAFLIRGMLAEPELKASFAGAHIDALEFADGDVVDGVYKVTSYERRGGSSTEVIELSIDVPRSYKGPPVRGLILSALEDEDGEAVRFVNETWLWRQRDEKPTLLESGLGRWFHRVLAGWLVIKGLGAVTRK